MTAAPTERGVLAVLDSAALRAIEERDQHDANGAPEYADSWEQLRADLREARAAIAELIEERDALRGALNRIVTYYELRKHSGRLPTMDSQAECEHELTMFGEARKVLAQTERVS